MDNIVQALTFKVYDFTLTAGGSYRLPTSGAYFRIMAATGAVDVTVEGSGTMPALQAGQALKNIPFRALVLRDASGAPNSGTILVSTSEFQDNRLNGTVDLSAASLAALESVDLNAATQLFLTRPKQSTGNYKASAAMAANTAEQIFAAGSNTNGAIILTAGFMDTVAAKAANATLLSKATAPTTVIDGEVYANSQASGPNGATFFSSFLLQQQQFVPAGVGLYMISDSATGGSGARHCRYILL